MSVAQSGASDGGWVRLHPSTDTFCQLVRLALVKVSAVGATCRRYVSVRVGRRGRRVVQEAADVQVRLSRRDQHRWGEITVTCTETVE